MASISLTQSGKGFYGYANGNTTYGYYNVTFNYTSISRNGTNIVITGAYIKMANPNSGYTTNKVYVDSVTIGSTNVGISGSAAGGTSYHTWSTSSKTVTATGVAASTTSVTVTMKGHRSGQSSGAQTLTGTLTVPKGEYTISYDANGGSGAPSSQTATAGTAFTLSSTVPSRTGYNFKGWGTASKATLVRYSAGGSITDYMNVDLYAVWERIPAIKVKSGSSWITGDLMYKSGSSYIPVSNITTL